MDQQNQETQNQVTNQPQATPGTGLEPNVAGALSYLLGFITGIFFYMTSKDKFVRFHAVQSTILSVAVIVVSMVIGMVPVIGLMFAPLINIGSFLLMLFMMWKAYQNLKYKLPVIGDYAEKYE